MENIELVNASILTEEEKEIANKILSEEYSRIKRMIKSSARLKVDFKEYDKYGKNRKYSINAEILHGGKTFVSSSWDWDLARAVHKAMEKMETEIEHKLHSADFTRTDTKIRKAAKKFSI